MTESAKLSAVQTAAATQQQMQAMAQIAQAISSIQQATALTNERTYALNLRRGRSPKGTRGTQSIQDTILVVLCAAASPPHSTTKEEFGEAGCLPKPHHRVSRHAQDSL
jgi:hypothetical protein